MSVNPATPARATALRGPGGRRWRPLRWAARVVLGMFLLALGVLLIAWLTLHWAILPRIEQWRPQVEARATQALGLPVRIGAIEVRSSGWVPALELRDVRLLDADQRPALQLPRVAAAVSARSLLSLELRFEQLLVEGAQLDIRRDAAGRISVAGLPIDAPGADEDGQALRDWFFRQREFVVRGGTLRWIDDQRDAPALTLGAVDLVVRNGLRVHEMRLDATPDAAWGERFSVRGRFTQPLLAHAGDWERWSGSAYIDLPRVDVRELRRHVDLPFELSEGDGVVRAWFELDDGQPRSATIDVALRAVAMRLARHVEPLGFEQVEGRLVGQRRDDGVSLTLQDFGFVTADGIRWPKGRLALSWRQRDGGSVTGGEFSAQWLDIGVMAQIASRVPLGDAVARLLAELQPEGIVTDLTASWQGPLDAPTHYQAKANFAGLTLASKPSVEAEGIGRPGLRNANVQVRASETGGSAQINLAAGALDFPGVFEQPELAFDTFDARLEWKIGPAKAGGAPPDIVVQVKGAQFSNPDARGEMDAVWTTGPGSGVARAGRYPGMLELNGRIARGAADKVARYLPLGISEAPRRYVEQAIRGGTVSAATFRIKGDLWDFPFLRARTPREGEFRIAGKVDGVTLAYVPPEQKDRPLAWPALSDVAGELVIDRSTLEIRNARAQLGGVAIGPVQVGIRSLTDPVLTIDGSARGPLAEMLRFVDTTPVRDWTSRSLAAATATGNGELRLALVMPLDTLDASTVKGSVTLAGNDVRIAPDTPLLANARGRVDFTDKGFTVVGATARVLGGEASFDGGTQPDGSLRFTGQGTATAEGLRRAADSGPLARFASVLSGQTAYRVNLGFVGGASEVQVTSNLVGMGIDLPAPLRKSPEAPMPLRYQTQLVAESLRPGQVPLDTLRFELGSVIQAVYERELSGESPRVLRGGIGLLEPAPVPMAGVLAVANLGAFRTDPWEAAWERLFGASGGDRATPAGASADSASASGYLPTQFALRVQELQVGARQFHRVVAGISREDGLWRANVDADQLSGYVEFRPGRSAQAAGRVHARLARLSLPRSDVEGVETLLDQQPPSSVPALDIVVDDFELRGKRLGRVEIEAVNRRTGEGREAFREWRLNRFEITVPEARLTGSGSWSEIGGTFLTAPGAGATVRRRAVMDFRLEVGNAGALLERLGTGKAVKGGKGLLTGQVSWLGSPLALDYPTLSGNVNVSVDAGQFLKAEPGAARLLSVLSLQSLPRRLALDFRDVFQEGFAFDNLSGDVRIDSGVAQTNNLRMRGVQAAVLMEGSADIARETQDLRVVVVPEINAGTASLAYAVINPAVGLGTFLAQALLRKPLAQAGTREFHVSGSWDDPKVERIERKPPEDVFRSTEPANQSPAAAPAPPRN